MTGKVCKVCGETKPLAEYYRHRTMRDGHLNKCRACHSAATLRDHNRRKAAKPEFLDLADFELEAVPTMARRDMIAWAATRYGKVKPSPDDILMARWPKYDEHDREHVNGYHADSVQVDRIVMARIIADAPRCMVCDTPMPGHHNRKYCSPECVAAVTREQKAKCLASLASKLTPEERERIVELRTTTSMTLTELAATVKRSVDTVRKVLDAAGIRGGSPRPRGSNSMSQSLGAA